MPASVSSSTTIHTRLSPKKASYDESESNRFRHSSSRRSSVQARTTQFATAYLENAYFHSSVAKCRLETGISAFLISVNNDLVPVIIKYNGVTDEFLIKTKILTGIFGRKTRKIPVSSIIRSAHIYSDIIDMMADDTIDRDEVKNVVCVQLTSQLVLPVMLENETDKHYFVNLLRVVRKE